MNSTKKYTILIAEDNPINIKVAEYTLKPIASTMHFARNGQEVLDRIITNSYDVILMDVKMPVMDGYEATKAIRLSEAQNNAANPMKIIAITSNNQPEEIEYCLSIGMDDFLAKPFTTNDALSVIETLCESNL
ncbi:MAG: response regulator [Prolixibacteraceae bacterium]|jgi:two-component system sensor histidine kinase/response regulator|nr:response regulator [Prolixibacteraceae bacterium]